MTQSCISRVHGTLSVRMTYTCHRCSRREEGTASGLAVHASSVDDVAKSLQRVRMTSHDMPVGWSFNGEFSCGCDRDDQ